MPANLTVYPSHVLFRQIEGCRKKVHGKFYVGKRCAYVYKAKTRKAVPQKPFIKSRVRAIWGKVTRLHGNTGCVRARFIKNLPGHAMGQRIRIVRIHLPTYGNTTDSPRRFL